MARINLLNFSGGMKTNNRASNAEQFNAGSSVVSHFDINKDYRRLKPVPALTEITDASSRAYKMVGMGMNSAEDTLFGVGEKMTNWFSSAWAYRVRIDATTNATYFPSTDVPVFNINMNASFMPAGFYTNSSVDGSDIIITDLNNNILPSWVENRRTSTCSVWVKATIQDVYVYYGNPTASQVGSTTQYGKVDTFSNFYRWFGWSETTKTTTNTRVGTVVNFSDLSKDLSDSDAGSFTEGVSTVPYGGVYLSGGTTSDNMRDDDSNNPWSGGPSGDFTYIAYIYPSSATPTASTVINSSSTVADMAITSARNITFTVNITPGTTITVTGTTPLTTSAWNSVVCTFQNGVGGKLYINGVLTNSTATADNLDNAGAGQSMSIGVGTGLRLGVVGIYDLMGADQVKSFHSSLSEVVATNVWTYGAQELFSNITPTYSGGVQVYKYDIATGVWSEYIVNGLPFGAFTQSDVGSNVPIYPLRNSFLIDPSGNLLAVPTTSDSGYRYGATTLFMGERNDTYTGQVNQYPFAMYDSVLADSRFIGSTGTRFPMNQQEAVDKLNYFTMGGSELSSVQSGNIIRSEFTAYGSVADMVNYGQYMAIASMYRNNSAIQLWDLSSTTADEFIDMGKGQIRAVGVVDQYLFGVLDSYLYDQDLSAGRQAMEVRVYTGNSQSQQVYRYDSPVTMEGQFTHVFDNAVNTMGTKISDAYTWYAKLPRDVARTTYLNGLWSLGNNEQAPTPNISIYCDTSGINDLVQVASLGNQIFVLDKDYKIWKISTAGVYTQTSSFETLIFDDATPEDDKMLQSIEVHTDELSGQTVSVYYRKDTDLDSVSGWVKICDHTTGMTKEATRIESTELNLPSFKEIQFKITSTGGNADIKGFSFTYEPTTKY